MPPWPAHSCWRRAIPQSPRNRRIDAGAGEHASCGRRIGTPRVFFVEPTDGASVKSPVHFKFGSEGVTISPVPPDPVTAVRPGMGHYHLGIDVDCLAPGTEIVKGTPAWVHFGKGDDVFDSQFAPGPHKVSLQVADDKHVAMPGLCSTMTINVTP